MGTTSIVLTARTVDDAFEDLYRTEYPRAYAVALALTGRPAVAEELAQDAFVTVLRRWDRVSGMDRPGAWINVVVANAARSALRRVTAETRALMRIHRPLVDVPPEVDEFWELVRTLPKRSAQVVALRYAAGLEVADIADALGCPEGTVRSDLHRARASIRQTLEARRDAR